MFDPAIVCDFVELANNLRQGLRSSVFRDCNSSILFGTSLIMFILQVLLYTIADCTMPNRLTTTL